MKLRKLTLALAAVGVVGVALTGCGSSSKSHGTQVSGVAIDGYLANALVCVDLNFSGTCDAGEPQTQTDNAGNFTLTTDNTTAPLVLQAIPGVTTDVTSGTPVSQLFLTAPQGSSTITPLTTLAAARAAQSGLTFAQAQAEIVSQLGLPAGTDLSTYDYVAASNSTDPATSAAARQAAAIAEVVAQVIGANQTAIAGANTGASTQAQNYAAVLDLLNPGPGGTNQLQQITQAVSTALASGVPVDTAALAAQNVIQADEIATVVDQADDVVPTPVPSGTPTDTPTTTPTDTPSTTPTTTPSDTPTTTPTTTPSDTPTTTPTATPSDTPTTTPTATPTATPTPTPTPTPTSTTSPSMGPVPPAATPTPAPTATPTPTPTPPTGGTGGGGGSNP